MWIVSHQSLRTHRKVGRLARALRVSKVTAVGHLHFLWWWAIDNAPDGDLTDLDPIDIAEGAGWEGAAKDFQEALHYAGFVDWDEREMRLHDWHDYAGRLLEQREANAERMRRARAERIAHSSGARAENVQRTSGARAGATEQNSTGQNSTVPNPTGDEDGARASTNGTATAVATRPSRPKAAPQPPPPEELQAFHVVLDGLPGYAPTTPFFEKVLAKYSALDLEEQAIRMADWLRRKHDRKCSAAFITNWLGDELEKLEARNHERNGQYDGLRGSPIAAAVDEDTAEFERAYRRKYGAPA